MPTINMLSSADKVKGQGVGSAYIEQVNLVKNNLKEFQVIVNKSKLTEIMHYHTIDFKHYLSIPLAKKKGKAVGYVHFLPETVQGSLKLPKVVESVFYKYIINFYKNMDYLVTVNPNFIKELEKYGIEKDKITYIPNFVSKNRFYVMNETEKKDVREKFKIQENKFVVLAVGQIQTRKGVKDFIEIAEKMPEIQFVWAGGFSFGNITDGYKELKQIVDNPPENVLFTGIVEREDMNGLYNVADVYFMPSYNELFPMAILEAMNTETPILLRDLDIYENILFDYYIRERDNEGFIKALKRLNEDSSFYKECTCKSREGSEFYSEENVLKMWKQFYGKVYGEITRRK